MHLVALAWIGHQPEGAAGTQLHVCQLDLGAPDAADEKTFLAPVELEGFAPIEGERHVGRSSGDGAGLGSPRPDECCDLAVAADVASLFELSKQP